MAKIKAISKPKPKQVYVDLETIHNPNPELVRAYTESHALDLFQFDRDNKAEFKGEERVFLSARASKRPIRHNLFGLYRRQLPGGREVFYAFDLMTARDFYQNTVTHTRMIGKFDKPIIVHKWGLDPSTLRSDSAPEPGEIGDPEVESMEETYTYEWHSLRDQLIRWKEEGIISDKSIFYVVIGNKKYSAPFSWDQWLNLSIPDLQLIGEHGSKFKGLMSAQDPQTLAVIKQTIQQEIQQSLTKSKT